MLRMHPAYFETRFRSKGLAVPWPESFAIVSACATTGSIWSEDRNASADEALRVALQEGGCWLHRVVGYSPLTAHAEPSWAIEIGLVDACKLGERFLQDAIYWVEHDRLFVLRCQSPEERYFVDRFSRRLDPSE
jgi:hypothetical protein